MTDYDHFACTLLDRSIKVTTNTSAVRARLEREFHPFFPISDEPVAPLLSTIVARSEPHPAAHDYDAGVETLLHDGTYDTGLRRARVTPIAEGRAIWSYDTGSLIYTNDADRSVELYNPDPRSLSLDVRRLVRNQTFVPWAESEGGVSYHASSLRWSGRGFMAMGDRGAGKTAVFMAAMKETDDEAEFLSGDRVIVIPKRPTMVACPESVNVFAGALRQFSETADLAAGVAEADLWTQSEKIRNPWRVIFDAFAARAHGDSSPVDVVLHPQYRPGLDEVTERSLSESESDRMVDANQITLRDANRPHWLEWFEAGPQDEARAALASLPNIAIEWSHVDHLQTWFRKRADDVGRD